MKQSFLHGKKNLFFLALYCADVAMYLLSAIAVILLFNIDYTDPFYIRFFLFSLLILMVNYSTFNLYKDKRNLFDDNEFLHIFYSVALTFIIITIFILMFDPDMFLLATSTLTLLLTLILTMLARLYLYKLMLMFRRAGYDRKRVLFFGKDNEELIKKVEENKSLGYKIIKSTADITILKKYLPHIDIVFLNKDHIDEDLLEIIIQNESINWKIVSPILNLVIDPVAFDEFKDYPIINVSNSEKASGYSIFKRAFDFVVSGLALAILSPLFLVVAILIKKTMPGPVFFRHERLGKNLKPFMLYKFRTMVADAEMKKQLLQNQNEVKGLFKMKNDPRITKLGKFLRRTCIDELPQLINVFKGEMSLVGPRPHLQSELENFKGWRMARFKVKPGLTGLWQVNGRHELNFDKAVLYDIYYIKHMSFFGDLSIIFKTIPAIMWSNGRY